MKLVVDGNDGTGKSTLVARLRDLGYDVADRGVPTKMTDDPSVCAVEGEVYLILDAPVEVCQARLAKAGKNLEERYHTDADLRHYRARFKEAAAVLKAALIDSDAPPDEVLARWWRDKRCGGLDEAGCFFAQRREAEPVTMIATVQRPPIARNP